jgi:competence CoiA-like predicted nuclease
MFTALDARRQPPAEVNLLFAHLRRGGDMAHKEELRAGEYVCKHCGQPLRPRFPLRRRWHFYHVQGASACPYGAGESEEHRWLKCQLVEQWSRRYKIPLERFRLEHPLAVGDGGRVADVYLEHGGRRRVFEVQLSPLPLEELKRRTLDYDDAGLEVYWVLLEDARWHDPHRQWLAAAGFPYLTARYVQSESSQPV